MDEGESKPESFDDDIIGWDEIQAETDGSDPAREWLRRCEIAYDTASGYMTGDAKESGSRIPVVTLRSLKKVLCAQDSGRGAPLILVCAVRPAPYLLSCGIIEGRAIRNPSSYYPREQAIPTQGRWYTHNDVSAGACIIKIAYSQNFLDTIRSNIVYIRDLSFILAYDSPISRKAWIERIVAVLSGQTKSYCTILKNYGIARNPSHMANRQNLGFNCSTFLPVDLMHADGSLERVMALYFYHSWESNPQSKVIISRQFYLSRYSNAAIIMYCMKTGTVLAQNDIAQDLFGNLEFHGLPCDHLKNLEYHGNHLKRLFGEQEDGLEKYAQLQKAMQEKQTYRCRLQVNVSPSESITREQAGGFILALGDVSSSESRRPGDEMWLELQVNPGMDPYFGTEVCFVTATDITQVKKLERELQTNIERERDSRDALIRSMFPDSVASELLRTERKDSPSLNGGGQRYIKTGQERNDDWQIEIPSNRARAQQSVQKPQAIGTEYSDKKRVSSLRNLLSHKQQVKARSHECVTIFFSDIVDFTTECAKHSPEQVMNLLDEMFLRFDLLCDYYSIYKVETIGDAYMAVAGLTDEPDEKRDARNCVAFARDAIEAVEDMVWDVSGSPVQIRVGVHSGSVMSGIVGRRMPRYALYGDTVNTASRMESTGTPMEIQISEPTYLLINSDRVLPWADVGCDWIEQDKFVKGKGKHVRTYLSQRTLQSCTIHENEISTKSPLTRRRSSVWQSLSESLQQSLLDANVA